MQIIKWNPLQDLGQFDDLSLFNIHKFGGDLAIDLFEEKDKVVAKISMPGINPDDVDLTLEENALTISGSREQEKETTEKDYYSKEIRRGSFARSVSLPRTVDIDKAEAEYKDGILSVTMPMVSGSKGKTAKIQIKK